MSVRGGLPAPDVATTIEEALLSRRGCRAFLPVPILRPDLDRLLALGKADEVGHRAGLEVEPGTALVDGVVELAE